MPTRGSEATATRPPCASMVCFTIANPRPLPFYTAVATNHGNGIKVFFELRAAGYNGSTYTLNYDAANDRLMGVYDQAVVKQKFDVAFVRDKS